MASNHDESSVSSPSHGNTAARHFLIGVFLSGVPILAVLWLSVDMTYGSWAAVGTTRWVGAIAVPLICGLLSARLGQRAIRVLSHMVESANLPF
jgi:FtsH-binding integral membrane protein